MSNFIRNKPELIRRAVAHREADRLNQGSYFERITDSVRQRFRAEDEFMDEPQLHSSNHVGLCAVACLATPLNDLTFLNVASPHQASYNTLAREFGIPRELTSLVDTIFEGLSRRKAKRWPEQFARALPRRSITAGDVRLFAATHQGVLEDEDTTHARDLLLKWLETGVA